MRNTIRYLALVVSLILITCSLPFSAALAAYDMPYYIIVDCSNNITTVYSSLDNSVVRQMICSTGTARTPTVQGTFTMPEKWKETDRTEWSPLIEGYGKYASRIKGSYLFHSFMYDAPDESAVNWESYAAMGTSASHGCIRLYLDDAKWIMNNCLPGTKVKIYTGEEPHEYLKVLLYEQTYTIDSGITYAEFLSMASAEGELGYSSEGEEVTALQQRMAELGLYAGDIDGFYGALLVDSVKAVQALTGLEVTGVADSAFIEMINSSDAPSSNISPLCEGMSGPAVVTLQKTLAALGLYNGSANGEFDAATTESVMSFQSALGYESTGIATAALQQDMLDSLEYLHTEYAATGFTIEYDEVVNLVATITSSKRLNVRAKKSTESTIIDRLDPGTEVQVVEVDGGWTEISIGDTNGYVRSSYLDTREVAVKKPRYAPTSSASARLPILTYGDNSALSEPVMYGTVNIDERVWLREAPDPESELVFMLSPGNICEIVSINGDWAYIEYGGKYGFTQVNYFDILHTARLTGEYAEAGSSVIEADGSDGKIMAMIISEEGAPLMSAASDTADVITTLNAGERADIIFQSTSWTQLKTDLGTGYVANEAIMTGAAAELDAYAAENFAPETIEAVVCTGSDASLNMRVSPSSEAEVICELENGSVVSIISDDGEWAQIEYSGNTGYVMRRYILADGEEPAVPEIPNGSVTTAPTANPIITAEP